MDNALFLPSSNQNMQTNEDKRLTESKAQKVSQNQQQEQQDHFWHNLLATTAKTAPQNLKQYLISDMN